MTQAFFYIYFIIHFIVVGAVSYNLPSSKIYKREKAIFSSFTGILLGQILQFLVWISTAYITEYEVSLTLFFNLVFFGLNLTIAIIFQGLRYSKIVNKKK